MNYLDAAAAAADPSHSGICFPVPVVVPIVDVMKKAEYKRYTYCTRQKSTQVAAKTEPTLQKNGLKIIAKLILGIRSALLGSSLRRSEHQEADQAEIERTIFENRTKSASRDPPRWSPNRTKINAKSDVKNRCVLDVHFGQVFRILGANLAPKWSQVGHQKRIVVNFN